MATTTNYGWTTPDDTSLVKDGASAIRTLGSSVDTTVKNLNPETTLGDISYRSSTANTNTRLAIGTSGQVLTVSSGVPAWTTISSGGMTLISETVASALSSLSFSSLGSYKQLLLLWNGLSHSASGSQFSIRFNNSSGNNYYQGGFGATAGAGFTAYADTATSLRCTAGGSGNNSYPFGNDAYSTYAPYGGTGSLLIDDYTSTSKKKFYKAEWYYQDELNSDRKIAQISGAWNDTSAITSIDIVRLTGTATFSNATNTSIRLYGVS